MVASSLFLLQYLFEVFDGFLVMYEICDVILICLFEALNDIFLMEYLLILLLDSFFVLKLKLISLFEMFDDFMTLLNRKLWCF